MTRQSSMIPTSCGGLAPVLELAERCGMHRLVADTLTLSGSGSACAEVKVSALVAGMVAGADSMDDMDLLRHGGIGRLFDQVRSEAVGAAGRGLHTRYCMLAGEGYPARFRNC
jgi:hypothetical protein